MKKLNDSFQIRNTRIKNRICLPPMVVCTSDDSGLTPQKTVDRYRSFARGGAGLLIQEATCVTKEGRLAIRQLGIWEDAQIPGLKQITDAVHAEGGVIVVQIHHAGVVGISEDPYCPSAYEFDKDGKHIIGHEMSPAEVEGVRDAFIAAAKRAELAGYDGVELHGCHSYLLSQFMNSRVNKRSDRYAQPMCVVKEIVEGIRAATSPDFICGIRLGAFEPALTDGIAHAKELEAMGIDFIDVSYGFDREADPICPSDFPYKDIIYAAGEIKKAVNVPVFAVNTIDTPAIAKGVLELTDVDMVDIGKSMMVDPDWANKALAGAEPGHCLHCPYCTWFANPDTDCPGQKLLAKTK